MLNLIRILSHKGPLISYGHRTINESAAQRPSAYPIFRYIIGATGVAVAATVSTSDQPALALMIPTRLARDAIAAARIVSGHC